MELSHTYYVKYMPKWSTRFTLYCVSLWLATGQFYPYTSGLLHWHWKIIWLSQCQWPNPKAYGKMVHMDWLGTQTLQNKTQQNHRHILCDILYNTSSLKYIFFHFTEAFPLPVATRSYLLGIITVTGGYQVIHYYGKHALITLTTLLLKGDPCYTIQCPWYSVHQSYTCFLLCYVSVVW